ncbi:four helix bundle protein [Neolewinella persica]|uniref:four helix bundle protein n=1 Tax=Neolewinella persica TaxID=70998 RepID=UPI0012F86E04
MSTRFTDILNQGIDNILPDPTFSVADVLNSEGIDGNSMLVADPASDYGQPKRKSKEEFVIWLKTRTKRAAIDIVNLLEKTGTSPGVNVVRYQLIKSATSAAANYRAACRARSGRGFYAKMCMSLKRRTRPCFGLKSWMNLRL